ncbi:fungal chitosanase of glycosyl hydrolase group 75-domain-containing protein [Chaetomium fimeti]|uniref:Endo-chitosanase n=1 Tax=Chaetomium fimeti TaxID=1854472 RepID=A0AAE0HNJ6_9PEZI|nr:fungal chitosanase of glycosyl hydrolase group 75-domain-containing protein [Chaetomium fimeti]
MVQLSTFLGALALTVFSVQAVPGLSSRQSIPDPSGEKNVGNGAAIQFVGGQCLGAADCASGCCATLPQGGQTIGVCSGVGAQNQAGKQGCGFEAGGADNQGGDQGGDQNDEEGGNENTNGGGNQNNGQAGGTVQPSGITPDPSGAANVGNGQGKQFITGECTSDADCGSGCCALVNTGEANFGVCSGPQANTQNGKQGHSPSFLLHILTLFLGILAVVSNARDAPQNLQDFYDAVRAKGHCSNKLGTGFYSRDNGSNDFAYCGDHLASSGVIYLQGPNGSLANLDVDCDGTDGGARDDGRCRAELSPDLQGRTSFRDALSAYGRGVGDLNPYVHPYVWRAFDPAAHGMRPLSVMAVLCPDRRLVYGVWGDTNGDDGDKPMVGEASLALVTACGGGRVTGANGIDEDAALFLGFTGDEAVPGPDGADWNATDFDAFEGSIEGLGDRLVERVRVVGDADAACSSRLGWAVAMAAAAVVAVLGARGLL